MRHRLCRVDDVPEGAARVFDDVGRFGVGVFNCHGTVIALANYCPHAGAPVCLGNVTGTVEATGGYEMRRVAEGEILRCPWHGWEFDIPSGETITEPTRRIKRYDVSVEDGWVFVDV